MPHIELKAGLVGITSLLDYRPQTARPLCELTQLLLRGPSSLTEAERELIATHVSRLNACTYCATAHGAAVCQLPGGSLGLLEAAENSAGATGLSEKMIALLDIAGKVQQGGRTVQAGDAVRAREAGASDREIHDTVLIAALFCLYNRYVDGLAAVTPADQGYYEALGRRITGRGYRMPEDGYQPL